MNILLSVVDIRIRKYLPHILFLSFLPHSDLVFLHPFSRYRRSSFSLRRSLLFPSFLTRSNISNLSLLSTEDRV